MIEPGEKSQPTAPNTTAAIGYCNFTAGGAPTSTDDETKGYSKNSFWYKATAPVKLWHCTEAADGAAVWKEIALTSTFTLLDITGTLPISSGGTGQTSAANAFAALSPLTTKGDLLGYSTQNVRVPVGADGTFLKADSTAARGISYANPLTVGNPITNGTNNYIFFQSGGNLAQSNRLQFDNTDFSLVNPTAATIGTPKIASPYFYLFGQNYRTDLSATQDAKGRVSMKPAVSQYAHVPHNDFVFESWSPGGSEWVKVLQIGTKPTDYLVTELTLRNSAVSGWGGQIAIGYTGTFSFKDLSGNLAPIAGKFLGDNPEGFPTLSFLQDAPYGISLNAYFNNRIRFAAGYPGTGGNASGSEFVQSDLPISIGVGGAGTAMFQIRKTTEQMRIEYDASNYFKVTVDLNGVATFDATGSGAKFVFSKNVVARIEHRVRTQADVATLTPNADSYDADTLSAQSQNLLIANAGGTPSAGQVMRFVISSAGIGGDTLSFGTDYLGTAQFPLPSATLPGGSSMFLEFHYFGSAWVLVNYQEI